MCLQKMCLSACADPDPVLWRRGDAGHRPEPEPLPDVPAFLRSRPEVTNDGLQRERLATFVAMVASEHRPGLEDALCDNLAAFDATLPEAATMVLQALVKAGFAEKEVAAAFMQALRTHASPDTPLRRAYRMVQHVMRRDAMQPHRVLRKNAVEAARQVMIACAATASDSR